LIATPEGNWPSLANNKIAVTMKPKLVVLSGAGISMESGIS
jgi:NAD-dependent SIR2 family protein deacetylase